jgi:tetratricopeptide (TPR) repeat protein
MTETLFERYREALRAGHVAGLRGRLEEAAAAYREAISLAGDRVVPRTALGQVLLRQGDPAAALEAFDGALALAPEDDESLLGRAQALVVLRRAAEAAATYDQLTQARESAGRSADATQAALRAAVIEPTDERRARHAALAGRPVEDFEYAVAEGSPTDAVATSEPSAQEPGAAEMSEDGAAAEPVEPDSAAAVEPVEPASGAAAEPSPPADPEELMAEAEEAVARGDSDAAAAAALAAGRSYLEAGQSDAAMDACVLGIGARPDDTELHLLLVQLGVSRAGEAWAADAHARLLRLAELDGDAAAAERIRALAPSVGARE